MTAELVHLAVIVVALAAAVDRVVDLLRRPAPGRVALTVALGLLVVALVLGHTWWVPTEGVWATGLVWLAQHAVVFGGVFALHLFFLCSAHPPGSMAAAVRSKAVLSVAALVVMTAAWLVAVLVERPVWAFPDFPAQPWSGAANLVFLGYLAHGLVGNARLTAHWARMADRVWLRRGLRLLTAAALALLGWAGYKVAVVALAMAGRTTDFRLVAMLLLALGLLLGLAGIVLPAWGPRLAELAAWPGRLRSYHRLGPLWRMLRAAAPAIELPAPVPWWRVEHRLYRRVIEIADGRAALRGHLDPAVAAAAGPDPAAAEAACLSAAVARLRTGAPPLAAAVEERRGGRDLAEEVAWLERVAAALP
ncbi:MAB_1171c family putative transporter [Actinokineospora sp. 24-640]